MTRTAVILTVYNRRETTLRGLRLLHEAIEAMGESYTFDVYMVDDGCTDGTNEIVKKSFPNICIIKGDGSLFWGGGMNLAWKTASLNKHYDYYLWFNDDSELYDDSFFIMFKATEELGENYLISGAFCDSKGTASYGGRNASNTILTPNGSYQEIFFMNGNLVLIPESIFKTLGYIDYRFPHGLGDWDYGLRAQKRGFKVCLTPQYVGKAERHDIDHSLMWSYKISLFKRLKRLYSIKFSPNISFVFNKRYYGLFSAIKEYIAALFFTICPFLFLLKKHK